eukprot:3941194-Rhodomonas_salina.3
MQVGDLRSQVQNVRCQILGLRIQASNNTSRRFHCQQVKVCLTDVANEHSNRLGAYLRRMKKVMTRKDQRKRWS